MVVEGPEKMTLVGGREYRRRIEAQGEKNGFIRRETMD